MQRVRDAFVVGCFALVLCATLGFQIVQKAGIELPAFLDLDEDASNLEARTYTICPIFSFASFAEGEFQDEFESWLSDSVPHRDDVLLANASLQRLCIAQMAAVFRYDSYPAFFDADYMYSTESDALYAIPMKQDEVASDELMAYADAINELTESYTDVNFVYSMPQRSNFLSCDLVSDAADNDYLKSLVDERLDDNVAIVDLSCETREEYDSLYYSTDHHWNLDGSYAAYCALASALGFEDELLVASERTTYEVDFYGSCAREALMVELEPDKIEDFAFDLPEYTALRTNEDGSISVVSLPIGKALFDTETWDEDRFFARYAEYYHGNYPLLTITNDEDASGGTLLIVGDSFSHAIDRLFVAHYSTVYVIDPRLSEQTVAEFLDEHDEVDDVVFMLTYQTVNSMSVINQLG